MKEHEYQKILVESGFSGHCATITLNDEKTNNSLSIQMIRELRAALMLVSSDPSLNTVLLKTAGKNFCSGGGLDWLKDLGTNDSQLWRTGITELTGLYLDLYSLSAPLIAVVQGNVVGAGVGLTCLCDVVLADTETRWILPEVSLGMVPTIISPALSFKVQQAHIHKLLFWKRKWTASEMQAFGIVSEHASQRDIADREREVIAGYLSIDPHISRKTKRLLRSFQENPFMERTTTVKGMALETPDNQTEVSLIKKLLEK